MLINIRISLETLLFLAKSDMLFTFWFVTFVTILKLFHVFHVSFILFLKLRVCCVELSALEGARQMDGRGFEVVVCEVP